ncbi:MAG: SpoIIE family protein phosphatase [Pseudomonadota bacterium]
MSQSGDDTPEWAEIAEIQHIGARSSQQDHLVSAWLPGAADDAAPRLLLVVADGMGGHVAGDVASMTAVNAFMASAQANAHAPSQEILNKALQTASDALFEKAAAHPDFASMGTTLVGMVITERKQGFEYRMVSVGDSPLWHWHADRQQLERANADHSLRGQLDEEVREGRISPEEAVKDPRYGLSNVLASALTAEKGNTYDIDATHDAPCPVAPGDILLLASDGLDTLEQAALGDLLRIFCSCEARALSDLADELIRAVLDCGDPHQDNVSILMARMQGGKSKRGFLGLF